MLLEWNLLAHVYNILWSVSAAGNLLNSISLKKSKSKKIEWFYTGSIYA